MRAQNNNIHRVYVVKESIPYRIVASIKVGAASAIKKCFIMQTQYTRIILKNEYNFLSVASLCFYVITIVLLLSQ